MQSRGLDDFRQQLAGLADERLGLFVFIRPRRFADEHELRVNAADAEHDVFARRRQVRAFHTRQRPFAQGGKRGGFGLRIQRRALGRDGFARQGEQRCLFGG